MNPTKKEIAEYIRFMREAAGLSQKQLADAIGLHPETLRRYESADQRPNQLDQFLKKLREIVVNTIKSRREANRK